MSQVNERFSVGCDLGGQGVRVAMIGSEGTEILMIFPRPAGNQAEEITERAVLDEAERRIRSALLALIGKNWPSDAV